MYCGLFEIEDLWVIIVNELPVKQEKFQTLSDKKVISLSLEFDYLGHCVNVKTNNHAKMNTHTVRMRQRNPR